MAKIKLGKLRKKSDKLKISKSCGGKKFICNENKKIYNTQGEAASDLSLPQSHISAILNKQRKSCNGFTFSYLR